MISVEEAQKTILDAVRPMRHDSVPIEEACGYVLCEDIVSGIDITPFDNSSMDGFAFRSADVAGASADSPVSLEVVAHIGAGHSFVDEVLPGQAVRIMTGAPIPPGCDCVEKIENVSCTGEGLVGDRVIISSPAEVGQFIRPAGEEVKAGEVLLKAGTIIRPATIGLIASAGLSTVPAYAKPKVGVFSLGSELVWIEAELGPGQLHDSNSYELAAQAAATGCDVVRYGSLPDDETTIRNAVSQAIDECDFVVTSGGASAGDFDFITQVAESLGTVSFKYVNMRPGKSQTFAVIRNTPFMGLAGNPAAAAVGFEMLVRPALLKMQGRTELFHPVQKAVLGNGLKKKDTRRNYLRGIIKPDGVGGYLAYPAFNQSSALFGTLSDSNCLIAVSEDLSSAPEGTPVDCVRIDIPEGTVI